jgi:predicted Zn-dependent peptidase
MVVAAAGAVDHEALVAQAERLFASLSPLPPEQAVTCAYHGGDMRQKRKLEQVHLVMGAEGVSFHDPLHEAMHVFAQVLGGGLSSRLFQELREKRGLCYDVHAFFTPFSDTGIFGIYGGTGAKDAGQFTTVMIDQLRQAALQLETAEIARAKAQIKVGMLAARESPTRRADQMARQLLAFGRVPSGQELSRRIESVNEDSLKQAADRLLQGRPTFAVIGPHTGLPAVKRLQTDFVPL